MYIRIAVYMQISKLEIHKLSLESEKTWKVFSSGITPAAVHVKSSN